MNPHDNPEGFLAVLAGIGAAVGIGKLLATTDPITVRLLTGRAFISAGLGAAAGAITYLVPDASPVLLYGVAAALSSIGTSTIEFVIKKRLGGPSE
jgi:hypothetical protein